MQKARFRALSMSTIQEPPAPLRGAIDSERLAELAASLSAQGQLQPILVRPDGDTFVIIAGHRRFLAARSLGWETIEAKILPAGVKDEQILSLVENLHREDLTPVEEARVVYNLVMDQNLDVDLVASRFAKSRTWIDGRLELLEYPPDLLTAIHAGTIGLGSARELARVKNDGYRQWLLEQATTNGATARTTRMWADEWCRTHSETGEEITAHTGPPPPYEGQPVGIGCAGCGELFPIAQLRPLYTCPNCIKDHYEMIDKARQEATRRTQ